MRILSGSRGPVPSDTPAINSDCLSATKLHMLMISSTNSSQSTQSHTVGEKTCRFLVRGSPSAHVSCEESDIRMSKNVCNGPEFPQSTALWILDAECNPQRKAESHHSGCKQGKSDSRGFFFSGALPVPDVVPRPRPHRARSTKVHIPDLAPPEVKHPAL